MICNWLMKTWILVTLCVVATTGLAGAQEEEITQVANVETAEEDLGWSNVTDLSLVITEGNSSTETFGFKNRLRREWVNARYTFRIDGVRSNTADDPIAVVTDIDTPENYEIVTFDKTPDVEKYYVENRYDRNITERFFWNAGMTWDRNKDAGIESRWLGFAGVGNIWWDREDLKFDTSYGLSYTWRDETTEDSEKDDAFPGFRFNWEYENQWGRVTTFENDWTFNVSLSDASDWNTDMTSSILVAMSERLALRVSLQWLYENIPALQDLDVFFRDPDGNLIGLPITVTEPKDKLDTVFSTSLVVSF